MIFLMVIEDDSRWIIKNKMIIFTIFTIYIIGCILSYGKFYASLKGVDYKYEDSYPIKLTDNNYEILAIIFITLLSWIGFLTGILRYFRYNAHYFLKYSDRDLKERYYNYWNISEKHRK